MRTTSSRAADVVVKTFSVSSETPLYTCRYVPMEERKVTKYGRRLVFGPYISINTCPICNFNVVD